MSAASLAARTSLQLTSVDGRETLVGSPDDEQDMKAAMDCLDELCGDDTAVMSLLVASENNNSEQQRLLPSDEQSSSDDNDNSSCADSPASRRINSSSRGTSKDRSKSKERNKMLALKMRTGKKPDLQSTVSVPHSPPTTVTREELAAVGLQALDLKRRHSLKPRRRPALNVFRGDNESANPDPVLAHSVGNCTFLAGNLEE